MVTITVSDDTIYISNGVNNISCSPDDSSFLDFKRMVMGEVRGQINALLNEAWDYKQIEDSKSAL